MADRPGRIWVRWSKMPVEREQPLARPPMLPVTGTDGKVRSGDYLRRSLGLPDKPPADEDAGVTWTKWPP
jgi:hypothetical protein